MIKVHSCTVLVQQVHKLHVGESNHICIVVLVHFQVLSVELLRVFYGQNQIELWLFL
jgi:hypothetical protein